MTNLEYKMQRALRGSQDEVAALLGVSRATINRRETGEQTISKEAELALLSLPVTKPKLDPGKAPVEPHNPATTTFGKGWSSDAYL